MVLWNGQGLFCFVLAYVFPVQGELVHLKKITEKLTPYDMTPSKGHSRNSHNFPKQSY